VEECKELVEAFLGWWKIWMVRQYSSMTRPSFVDSWLKLGFPFFSNTSFYPKFFLLLLHSSTTSNKIQGQVFQALLTKELVLLYVIFLEAGIGPSLV